MARRIPRPAARVAFFAGSRATCRRRGWFAQREGVVTRGDRLSQARIGPVVIVHGQVVAAMLDPAWGLAEADRVSFPLLERGP